MLIWVCALHCEAKPVIDRYRLKKSQENNAFDLYLGDDMACVISGTGKLASASACAWAAARHADAISIAWINLGIAGAAEHELGALFSLHQVIDADDGRRYYPAPGTGEGLIGNACKTLSQPSEDYREGLLYDMEASGFMHASLRFSSAELIKSLKIVSDNPREKMGRDRQGVSDLINGQIEVIDRQAEALALLNGEITGLEPEVESWQRLVARAHFSQTQKSRLRVLWRYLMNRHHDADCLLQQLDGRTAGAIIDNLAQLSHRDSEKL